MIDYNKLLRNKYVHSILEWVYVIIIAFCIAIVVKAFIVETDIVNGISMEPSFIEGEKVLVEKLSYRFREPKRGEVIVFNPINTKDNYIKRIIALPGETVDIKDGNIIVDDDILYEDYIQGENYIGIDNIEFPYTVLDGEYFVLGDNRMHSVDSRSNTLGKVSLDNIKGRCFFVLTNTEHQGFIKEINYDD